MPASASELPQTLGRASVEPLLRSHLLLGPSLPPERNERNARWLRVGVLQPLFGPTVHSPWMVQGLETLALEAVLLTKRQKVTARLSIGFPIPRVGQTTSLSRAASVRSSAILKVVRKIQGVHLNFNYR